VHLLFVILKKLLIIKDVCQLSNQGTSAFWALYPGSGMEKSSSGIQYPERKSQILFLRAGLNILKILSWGSGSGIWFLFDLGYGMEKTRI
jgi:hypothetical protein